MHCPLPHTTGDRAPHQYPLELVQLKLPLPFMLTCAILMTSLTSHKTLMEAPPTPEVAHAASEDSLAVHTSMRCGGSGGKVGATVLSK